MEEISASNLLSVGSEKGTTWNGGTVSVTSWNYPHMVIGVSRLFSSTRLASVSVVVVCSTLRRISSIFALPSGERTHSRVLVTGSGFSKFFLLFLFFRHKNCSQAPLRCAMKWRAFESPNLRECKGGLGFRRFQIMSPLRPPVIKRRYGLESPKPPGV